jgi:hypothetical protein
MHVRLYLHTSYGPKYFDHLKKIKDQNSVISHLVLWVDEKNTKYRFHSREH